MNTNVDRMITAMFIANSVVEKIKEIWTMRNNIVQPEVIRTDYMHDEERKQLERAPKKAIIVRRTDDLDITWGLGGKIDIIDMSLNIAAYDTDIDELEDIIRELLEIVGSDAFLTAYPLAVISRVSLLEYTGATFTGDFEIQFPVQ